MSAMRMAEERRLPRDVLPLRRSQGVTQGIEKLLVCLQFVEGCRSSSSSAVQVVVVVHQLRQRRWRFCFVSEEFDSDQLVAPVAVLTTSITSIQSSSVRILASRCVTADADGDGQVSPRRAV